MKVKVGDITKIRTGKLDANASSEDGAYPFFTCSREPLRISTYSYDCECVLVAGNGDLNVKYYNGKFDAYQRTYIIEDNSNGRLYMPYLYLFMEGYIEELRRLAIGGVIKYIKLGNLTDALVKLPSLEEQKNIVKTLFKLKLVLDQRQDQLNQLDDLIKARFVELFGSLEEHIRLGDCSELITKGASPKWQGLDYIDHSDGTLFVTSENIREGFIDYSKKKYLPNEINSILPRSVFFANYHGRK